MRIDEVVSTALGDISIAICICDICNRKEAKEIAYVSNGGWYQVSVRDPDAKPAYPREARTDYCSLECLLMAYIPDVFDEDSTLSKEVVERLQEIVKELG